MFWNAKNECVAIDDTDMDYVTFGNGNDILIMIPGLGDGLTTVKGMAVAMALPYRIYAKNYKIYIFSRKNQLEKYQNKDYSTRDMAADLATVIKKIGIAKAKILGISQGGMIAQYLAIDYPELVDKLVLAVTLSKPNEMVHNVITSWIRFAENDDYKSLIIDTAEKSYSENYLKKYRPLYPILCRIGKPKDFTRFIVQALSCVWHDAYAELGHIACPTLVIGGDQDRIVGVHSSIEIADKIQGSKLHLYKGLGHAAYEEAKDFNERVMDFLTK